MLSKFRLIITTKGSIPRSSTHLIKTNPFELFKLIQKYNTERRGSSQDLTYRDFEERAIVAFFTYDFIYRSQNQQFIENSRSLRERIYRLEHLATNLLKRMEPYIVTNQEQNQQDIRIAKQEMSREQIYRGLQKAGFQRKNIDKVIQAYDIKQGTAVNFQVWKQQRFLQACNPNGKITLQPNIGTGYIFKKITSEFHQSCIISGDKGCGKSFAYLNYFYLSNYMIDYRMHLFKNRLIKVSQRFENLVDQAIFQKIKKLFYVPLKHISEPHYLEEIFEHQTHIINKNRIAQMQISQLEKYSQINIFLSRIRSYYSQARVKTVCVADEANVYLSVFRSLKYKTFDIINEVQKYSHLLNCLQYSFSLLIYNSSQAVEAKRIHSWIQTRRSKTGQQFHDIYYHDRAATQNLHISYSKFLFSRPGHIYLYSLLWDQICKNIPSLENHQIIRNIFEECFGLPSSQNIENSNKSLLKWWQTDVKNLNIRKSCSYLSDDIIKIGPLLNKAGQDIQNSKLQLTKLFQKLKREAVEDRQRTFQTTVAGYLNKSQNDEIKAFRFALLYKMKIDYFNTKFSSQDIPITEVDFLPTIEQFSKLNSRINYAKQAGSIAFLLGCGQQIKEQVNNLAQSKTKQLNRKYQFPHKFRFLINSQSLEQIISILARNQEDVLVVTNRILDKKVISHDLLGNLLDVLYYTAFQYETIDLKILQKTLSSEKQTLYNIKKLLPFEVKTGKAKLIYQQQFQKLIEQANNKQRISVLGFQASEVPTDQIQVGHKLNTRNPIFDFVIVQKTQGYLLIQSFDETLGQLTSKLTGFLEKFNQLAYQIRNLKEENKIKIVWKHRILAYDHLVDSYLRTNHTKFKIFHKMIKNGEKFPSTQQYATALQASKKAKDSSKDSRNQSLKSEQNPSIQAISKVQQKKEKINLSDLDLLDSEIGQIHLGLSIIPNKGHFILPLANQASEQSILKQMMKISQALKNQKHKPKK